MAGKPDEMGLEIAQSIPGVNILQLLRALGQKMMGTDQVMQQLGARPPQGGPQYRVDQKLPQSGGVDANGQPIIIPPAQGGY